MQRNRCDVRSGLIFAIGLTFGTMTILSIKSSYDMFSVGCDGTLKQYQKPVTTVLVMFAAMFLALPIHVMHQIFFKQPENQEKFENVALLQPAIPAIFDMLATALSQTGLLFTTASMFQLVRCSVMIVTASLKVIVFKEKLANYMYLGVIINTLAMVIIGSTGFFETGAGVGSNPKLGITLILSSCFVQGAQFVVEEKIMSISNCPPLVVIGMEGFWGLLLTFFIVVPLAYYFPGDDCGSFENIRDSWVMWNNNPEIKWMVFCFFISILGYNSCSIFVTRFLSAVWRAILDNFRPISIWGVDLFIYYAVSKMYGEAWNKYSSIQLFGMALLFIGTATYNGSFLLSGSPKEDVYEDIKISVSSNRNETSVHCPYESVVLADQAF